VNFWDFEGRWQLSRLIIDKKAGRDGRFDGEARFERSKTGFTYHETGQIRFPGQAALNASQNYLWTENGQGADVTFSDGRAFHEVKFQPIWETNHECHPDWYAVRYDFSNWPKWSSTWSVKGPRKDYTMVSDFLRSD